nr:recombinase family protein [Herpetosiphon geysericola]
MYYAYLRVSTNKQTTDQQRFEILNYADAHKLTIDYWIDETASGTMKIGERKFSQVLAVMNRHDVLIVTELSRLGRSLMEVMSILYTLMEREITVQSSKKAIPWGTTSTPRYWPLHLVCPPKLSER